MNTEPTGRTSGSTASLPGRVVVRRRKRFFDLRLLWFTVLALGCTAWLGLGRAPSSRPAAAPDGTAARPAPDWMRDHASDLAARGLYEPAVAAYERCLDDPGLDETTRANLHFRIAEIFRERLGAYEKAIDHYLRVKRVDPASPRVPELGPAIVACFDGLGRTGDARRTLDRITALSPRTDDPADPVVARVGTRSITRRDVEEGLAALPEAARATYGGAEGRRRFLQEALVGPALLAGAARRAGLDRQGPLRRRLDAIRAQILGQAYLEAELGKLPGPTEADLALFHKAHGERYPSASASPDATGPVAVEPLAACRDRVARDWTSWKRRSATAELLGRLLKEEDVEIHADRLDHVETQGPKKGGGS